MREFGFVFALYAPIYVYVAIVLYFIILISTQTTNTASPSLNTYHQTNRSVAPRILFILTLAAMLGTPPTLGFFAKLLTFYMLIQLPGLGLGVSIMLTLILIIFYLQSIRTRSIFKKKSMRASNTSLRKNTIFLIYGQLLFILFTLTIPYVFDIVYCMFI